SRQRPGGPAARAASPNRPRANPRLPVQSSCGRPYLRFPEFRGDARGGGPQFFGPTYSRFLRTGRPGRRQVFALQVVSVHRPPPPRPGRLGRVALDRHPLAIRPQVGQPGLALCWCLVGPPRSLPGTDSLAVLRVVAVVVELAPAHSAAAFLAACLA